MTGRMGHHGVGGVLVVSMGATDCVKSKWVRRFRTKEEEEGKVMITRGYQSCC